MSSGKGLGLGLVFENLTPPMANIWAYTALKWLQHFSVTGHVRHVLVTCVLYCTFVSKSPTESLRFMIGLSYNTRYDYCILGLSLKRPFKKYLKLNCPCYTLARTENWRYFWTCYMYSTLALFNGHMLIQYVFL